MKKLSNLAAAASLAVALFIGTNVKAQTTPANQWRLGIGVEGGLPTGNEHDFSNFELGGTARLQYGFTNNFAATLTSGYYNFFGKTIPGSNEKYSSLGMVPVKLGIKAFFAPNIYFGAEAGAGFETSGYKDTKLILSPALGYANKSWDVGVRYENFSGIGSNNGPNFGTVALRVAYGFSL